jgi:hypothetical protein
VLVACWSVKGGAGATVIAASLALVLSRRGSAGGPGVLLADLAGDVPAVLGLPEPDSPGLAGWLDAGTDVPVDALARLEVGAAPQLGILPRGAGELRAERATVLASLLDGGPRTVVADCGRPGPVESIVVHRARRSILVIRPCYLALRRAMASPIRPTEVVLVHESGRHISRDDVQQALGAPIVAEVDVDPAVARAVDAGLLTARLPRPLERSLRDVA